MSQMNSMKQIGVRNMGYNVEMMEWSNKMDLIAIGNSKGEVIINRLNWQKIVTFPVPGENLKVRSLSWQPDETMIAVGYNNGKVSLLDAEKEDEVCSVNYGEDIQSVYWTKAINTYDHRQIYRNRTELTQEFFLPTLPNLNVLSSTAKINEDHKSFAKGSPCFLVVTLCSGKIFLLVLGVLQCGSIDVSQHVQNPDDFSIHDVRVNGTFEGVYVFIRDGNQLKVMLFENEILRNSTSPMLTLVSSYAHVLETKNYINETIQCIVEAWETVLLEMDNKLTKYANTQPEGSLSADFLELLIFGYASTELEEFLTSDLTEKGLKKLGNSVELSYSTIQNLVTKPLQCATVNMFYFLNNLKGLSRNTYFCKNLITTESTDEAIRACGAFLMKILELQQIIDQCVNDMKIFFCWLCLAIVRLMHENIIEEGAQVSQEDIIYLAEYLNNFDDCIVENDDGTVTKRKFNLEKVGQYLENSNLQQPAKSDIHHRWNKLLDENECLRNCPLMYPHDKNLSLIQQRDKLTESISKMFDKPNQCITENFKLKTSLVCCQLPSDFTSNHQIRTTFFVNETVHSEMLVATIARSEVIIIELDARFPYLRCTRVNLKPGPFTREPAESFRNLTFVDLKFYNENIISMLLQNIAEDERAQCYFIQLPLDLIRGKHSQHRITEVVNLIDTTVSHSLLDNMDYNYFKHVDGNCTTIAVSGSRKVAAVLSDNSKKIGVFEMEIEDDDDEAEMSQNSLLEISKESAASAHE